MPSNALNELKVRLADVDELVQAHASVTGGGQGRPAKRQGAAITRAGVVLLAAAMEAFIEDLFEEAGDLVFAGLSAAERKELYKNTSGRLNNADAFKTNMLYLNMGCPRILSGIRWKKFSNATFIVKLNKFVETRGAIAHGKRPGVTLLQLRGWKKMVENYAPRLEAAVAVHVQKMTGATPVW